MLPAVSVGRLRPPVLHARAFPEPTLLISRQAGLLCHPDRPPSIPPHLHDHSPAPGCCVASARAHTHTLIHTHSYTHTLTYTPTSTYTHSRTCDACRQPARAIDDATLIQFFDALEAAFEVQSATARRGDAHVCAAASAAVKGLLGVGDN